MRASGLGFNLAPGSGALVITRETHGDLVQQAWRVIADAAVVRFGYAETFEG